MATITEVINSFCDLVGQPRPISIVSSSTPASRSYLSLLLDVGNDMLKMGEWSVLKRLYTFTTQTGVSQQQLPGDFYRSISETQFSVTNQLPLVGPISDANLAFRSYGVVPVTPYYGFQNNGPQGYVVSTSPYTQVSAGFMQLSPAGQNNTDQQVIAYGSKNWIWPQSWAPTTAYLTGQLATGLGYMYRMSSANGNSGTTRPNWTSGSSSDGSLTWSVYTEKYSPLADSDFVLFDDDLVVEGLRWKWLQKQKQEFAQQKKDWEDACWMARGRQNGVGKVSAAGNGNSYGLLNVPIGNWNV